MTRYLMIFRLIIFRYVNDIVVFLRVFTGFRKMIIEKKEGTGESQYK